MSELAERARQRHPDVRVEHPPETWSCAADDAAVDALVDALVAFASARIGDRDGVQLIVNNVTVELDPDDDDGGWEAGDYIALGVEHEALATSDSMWNAPLDTMFVDAAIDARARGAGVAYGYTRGAPRPSITCLVPRA